MTHRACGRYGDACGVGVKHNVEGATAIVARCCRTTGVENDMAEWNGVTALRGIFTILIINEMCLYHQCTQEMTAIFVFVPIHFCVAAAKAQQTWPAVSGIPLPKQTTPSEARLQPPSCWRRP